MTAPQPTPATPEEFADVLEDALQVGSDTPTINWPGVFALIAARDAALLAPLRAEVERLTRERDEAVKLRSDVYAAHGRIQDEIANVVARAERAEAENARLRAALDEAKNWLMSIAIVDQDDRPLNERLAREFDWRRRSTTQESMARRGHEAAAKALAPEGGPGKEATSGNR